MKEQEICYADLDPIVGREQGGRRPIIIIKVLKELNLCVIVPLTTALERLELPYTLKVNSTSSTNLNADSVALAFHIRTISTERIDSAIGVLEDSHARKIGYMIKSMLSLS